MSITLTGIDDAIKMLSRFDDMDGHARGALVVIPINSAAAGEPFTGKTDGVWLLPATTGLAAGALVKWDSAAGKLVADSAKDADDFGKLITAESGGYAEALLSN